MQQLHAIVRDAGDTFSQEKLPKRSSTESLNTLDTESLTCPQDSRRNSDISLENGVRDTLPVRKSDFSLENSVRTDRSPSIGTTYASLSASLASTHKTIRVSMFVQSFAKGQIDMSSHVINRVKCANDWYNPKLSPGRTYCTTLHRSASVLRLLSRCLYLSHPNECR
eukprot:scaffold2710_cov177-Skeletonema_dohrnii-CCMP3373.AAC.1